MLLANEDVTLVRWDVLSIKKSKSESFLNYYRVIWVFCIPFRKYQQFCIQFSELSCVTEICKNWHENWKFRDGLWQFYNSLVWTIRYVNVNMSNLTTVV